MFRERNLTYPLLKIQLLRHNCVENSIDSVKFRSSFVKKRCLAKNKMLCLENVIARVKPETFATNFRNVHNNPG